jgi:AraC-like DNA-binding protein
VASEVPMISALTLSGMPQFIEAEIGSRALKSAYSITGLPTGVMDVENAYIPEAALSGFISEAARAAGDGKLGLQMIPYLSVASYGTWGKYVLEAQTLGEGLERVEQIIRLHASYRTWTVSAEGALIWIRYKFQVDRNAHYENLAYCGVGVLCNIVRHFVGSDWNPCALELDLPKPTRISEFEDVFACPIAFGSNSIGIAFKQDELSSRNPVAASSAAVSLAEVVRSRSSAVPKNIPDAVSEIIRLQIRKGKVDMDAASRSMNFGVRQLRRTLDREGTSFRKIARQIRTDLAKELILGTSLPLSVIAEEVGYANPSLFTRAFARDVGQSPSSYRNSFKHSLN